VFNGRFHDVRPLAIVRCARPEDARETIAFLAGHGLENVVRSGGHCFAGHSSTRGVVIDVTPMHEVSVSGGLATVGAGARLGDVADTLREHDLALPAGTCPTVGIAGLALGGGLGILGRKYGLTCDQLVSAQVVLADGRIVDCDDQHNEDLFWALRGAGAGNFGVVTSFVFRAVPAAPMTNIEVTWPFAQAARAIEAWQVWSPHGPDELAASLKVTTTGDVEEPPAVRVFAAFGGPEADAMELIEALVDQVGADPISSSHRFLSFTETRRFWAQLGAYEDDDVSEAPARQPYFVGKSEFFRRPLPTEAVDRLLEGFFERRAPGEECELDFMPWAGAYNRVPPDATAFVHRQELFQLKHSIALEPGAAVGAKQAAQRRVHGSWSTVHRWGSGHVFPNFPDPELENWGEAYYGSNYERLVQVKSRYDPEELFRFPQSLPAS
jgi:FAD/FMN-containing dehydrogenase